MLHFITWSVFIRTILILALLYYPVIFLVYYRKEIMSFLKRNRLLTAAFTSISTFGSLALQAQTADGNNGLNQANTMVRSYFEAGTNLMYAVGAILGLIGAIKVFSAYQGHQREDAAKLAAAWFGSCIFLVVVSTVLKSFFGL